MKASDHLIVGGGTAGAVVASRLSKDARNSVVLIEAGPDMPPGRVPADIADTFPTSTVNPSYFWPDLEATLRQGAPPRRYPQARLVGGGSSITGMASLRGIPSDYDHWAALGAEGWSWADVLPAFRRIENDLDRSPRAAAPGPFPIKRVPSELWPDYIRQIGIVAGRNGFGVIDDVNEESSDGFFSMPLSQDGSGRATTARCYLTDEVRRRRNLVIVPNTRVDRLLFDGRRVTGVAATREGAVVEFKGRDVIVSAGAIHSPALLLRSGIGPAEELGRLGIPVILNRAGVGRRLQNHQYLHYVLTLPCRARAAAHSRQFLLAGARLSSRMAECPTGDLMLTMSGRASGRRFGPALAMVGAALYAPMSRGAVCLKSRDANIEPQVDFRMFDDPRDAPRMIVAARAAESILLDQAVTAAYNEAFLLPPIMALNHFNRPWIGGLLGMLAQLAIEAPSELRRRMIAAFLPQILWLRSGPGQANISDDAILSAAAPMGHPIGTCSIGNSNDPMAVVDSRCRVHGIGGLRVVDASVMPCIPSANTNLPTIMIAERAAEFIKNG